MFRDYEIRLALVFMINFESEKSRKCTFGYNSINNTSIQLVSTVNSILKVTI